MKYVYMYMYMYIQYTHNKKTVGYMKDIFIVQNIGNEISINKSLNMFIQHILLNKLNQLKTTCKLCKYDIGYK